MLKGGCKAVLLLVIGCTLVSYGPRGLTWQRLAGGQEARPKAARIPTARPPQFDAATRELFTSDARTKLGPGQPGAAAKPEGSTPAEVDPEGSPEPSQSTGFAWSSLVSAATLEDEIKAQVDPAGEAIKTPSAYKGGGNKLAGRYFGVAAAMFHVIAGYDGEVRWKREAAGLRALFAKAGFNSTKVNSDDAFKEARLRQQDLAELIKGSKVAADSPEEVTEWSKVVSRSSLMQRMEEAYQTRLKVWTADQGSFGKNLAALTREAELLAMLSRIIQDPSYEDADNDSYREYAGELQREALGLAAAVTAKNLENAQSAVSGIYRNCDACHGDLAGSDALIDHGACLAITARRA